MLSPLLFGFILTMLALAWLALSSWAARTVTTVDDYFVAKKELGVITVTLTLLTTQIGGNFLSGIAQEAYTLGYYAFAYALSICTGFMLFALGIARRLKALPITTIAQIFEINYGSSTLKYLASLGSIVTLWLILVAQMATLSTITSALGVSSAWALALFWLIIIANTTTGGLSSLAIVDVVKQIMIIIMFIGIFIYTFGSNVHAFSHLLYVAKIQELFTSVHWYSIAPECLFIILFCLMQQDIAQCFFAASSPAIAARGAWHVTLFLLLFSWAPVYFGMQAKLFDTGFTHHNNPIALFLSSIDNYYIFLMLIIGIVAAITSTASALLCAISGNIVQDFIPNDYDNRLWLARVSTFITGITALAASLTFATRMEFLVGFAYQGYVCTFFVPLAMAYLNRRSSPAPALFAIVAGGLAYSIIALMGIPSLYKVFIPLGCSLISYVSGVLYRKSLTI